jgi:hypothetical protein
MLSESDSAKEAKEKLKAETDKPATDEPKKVEGELKKEEAAEAKEDKPEKKEVEHEEHHPKKVLASVKAIWKDRYAKKFEALQGEFFADVEKHLKRKLKLSPKAIDSFLYDEDDLVKRVI